MPVEIQREAHIEFGDAGAILIYHDFIGADAPLLKLLGGGIDHGQGCLELVALAFGLPLKNPLAHPPTGRWWLLERW